METKQIVGEAKSMISNKEKPKTDWLALFGIIFVVLIFFGSFFLIQYLNEHPTKTQVDEKYLLEHDAIKGNEVTFIPETNQKEKAK